jgi:antitoxin component YwqK of YwqJK toxin-antitoxin module
MNLLRESDWNSIKSEKMKLRLTVFFLALLVFASCKHNTTEVESTYPDGSPRRVCVYLRKGETKELIKETVYYKNKKVQVEGEYKSAQRNGRWTAYYESGKVWSEGFFKAGKNDGKRVTYFPDGKIRYEGFYKNDNKVGIWKFYDETGKLVKAVDFSKTASNPVQDVPAQVPGK